MKWEVVVKQTTIQYKVFTIEAEIEYDAIAIAERDAEKLDFWSWDEIDTNDFEVVSVEPAGH